MNNRLSNEAITMLRLGMISKWFQLKVFASG